MEEKSPERKYVALTSYIKILSYRASESNKEVSAKLKELSIYLEEVRKQRHLCMMTEVDRIERVRFEKILRYVDSKYDGTENSVKEICKELNKREDIDEVLKYHKREIKKEEKEMER